ncbi:MAG: RluA family pseudouridine synthase [Candidatus Moranbacteria bacterium]|nr:RluA family pseudouridine synthase [Candidatus Moranbacteria bacterium]
MSLSSKITFEIPRRLVNSRLDVALKTLVQERYPKKIFSRGLANKCIQDGRVLLGGKKRQSDFLVHLHDVLECFEKDLFPKDAVLGALVPTTDIPVLFEDEHIVVIDKPAGLQMHPAGNLEKETVAHWIVGKYPLAQGVGEDVLRPGIVHRLDKETSGIVVIAKTKEAFVSMKELFQKRMIRKTYIALVYGHMPEREGKIQKPISRRSGELKRFVVEKGKESQEARDAITEYTVLIRYENFDLVEARPKTGRTHQIRAHFASLGCPLVGDKTYTFKSLRRENTLFPKRHLLHATKLVFNLFSKQYDMIAPLPDDFQAIVKSMQKGSVFCVPRTYFSGIALGLTKE